MDETTFSILVPVNQTHLQQYVHPTFEVTVTVKSDYPCNKPLLSIKCNFLSNNCIARLKRDCQLEFDKVTYNNQPILLDIIQWLERNVLQYILLNNQKCEKKSSHADQSHQNVNEHKTVLIKLDHMRSRKAYCDLLLSWWKELGIFGRIIFYSSYVLLLLQGPNIALKVSN